MADVAIELPRGCVKTQRELAEMLDVGVRQVAKLLDEGMRAACRVELDAGGKAWHVPSAWRWRVERAQNQKHGPPAVGVPVARGDGEVHDLVELRRQHEGVKLELSALKLERERGDVVPRAEIAGWFAKRAAKVKGDLLMLPDWLAPRLEGLTAGRMVPVIRDALGRVCAAYAADRPPWTEEGELAEHGEG